jgi:hypothetical protein
MYSTRTNSLAFKPSVYLNWNALLVDTLVSSMKERLGARRGGTFGTARLENLDTYTCARAAAAVCLRIRQGRELRSGITAAAPVHAAITSAVGFQSTTVGTPSS